MALKNRKMRTKQRGTRSVGRGRKGTRVKDGGRGNAGGQKHKRTWFIKYAPDHFGHDQQPARPKPKTVNIGYLNDYAVKTGKSEVDAHELGFGKVLGGGDVTLPLKVKASKFTPSAKEKLEKAGGSATES
jgi:large subunit ribosomal protein L15